MSKTKTEDFARLNVNISQATRDALRDVACAEGISYTEAVRRLVGYGHVVYKAARCGREVRLVGGDRADERVILLDQPNDAQASEIAEAVAAGGVVLRPTEADAARFAAALLSLPLDQREDISTAGWVRYALTKLTEDAT